MSALARAALLALVAIAFWFLARYLDVPPAPLGADAPQTAFSSARAEAVLARVLGPEKPHPASTAQNAAVRARLLAEYARLGIKARTYRALGCNLNKRFGGVTCGTVTDIVADAIPGAGKAIVLLAHYDSVPAGPGAADDESGDAAILETIRALRVRAGKTMHPVLAVNTDGEEFGLLGAAAFLDSPVLKSQVGAVVNVEARGNQGQSMLFQTSPGDGPLINLYARSVPLYAASSLFAVIYKFLPNDTDLTLFIREGFLSYNFAFAGNVADYHTALDRRENLDPGTLQMQGNNLLGMAWGLMHTDLSRLRGGKDAIYLTLYSRFLPRLPATWALPLGVFAFVLLLASLWVEVPTPNGWLRWFLAFLIVPAMIAGALATGALEGIAVLISGQPDPSYAHPTPLRIALGAGIVFTAVLVSRLAEARAAALGVWLFLALVGIVTAVYLPGLSPYFLFPVLVASPLVFLQAFFADAWTGRAAQIVLFVAALPALAIWLSLSVTAEPLMGLRAYPLVTIPMAFAAATLVPLLAASPSKGKDWIASLAVFLGIALIFAVSAGFEPAFSRKAPQRLDISYVENSITHRAFWAASAGAPLPASLREAAHFSIRPEQPYPFAYQDAYTASAGALRFAPPTATVTSTPLGTGRRVALALHGSAAAQQMVLIVPRAAGLRAIEIDGKRMIAPSQWRALRQLFILCATQDCMDKTITLDIASRSPVDAILAEQRYGLPPDGGKLQAARPDRAVVSQNGDVTVLINSVAIPRG